MAADDLGSVSEAGPAAIGAVTLAGGAGGVLALQPKRPRPSTRSGRKRGKVRDAPGMSACECAAPFGSVESFSDELGMRVGWRGRDGRPTRRVVGKKCRRSALAPRVMMRGERTPPTTKTRNGPA